MAEYGRLDLALSKTRMKKQKSSVKSIIRHFKGAPALLTAALLVLGGISTFSARADVFQQQIDSLNAQNAQTQGVLGSLQAQASSYQDAINKLQQQIAGLQAAITINQSQQQTLQAEIDADQVKLNQQKSGLAQDLKAMYVSGQMTTVEMLATSKDLSNYVDQATYKTAVQNKIQDTLAQITALQNQLNSQKTQVQQLIAIQQQQQVSLSSSQAQQQNLLAMNEGQQASYNQQIQANQQQIAVLRAEQIAANRQLVSSGRVDFSGSCGGSYPATASGPYGTWGCDYSLDNTIDNWGMYNRECVSYTAWMVYKTYGYMPYWGGEGDARQWPGDAQAAGIPTGYAPKVNSVAIYMGGPSDPWGHAMWVKSINGDGTITVDQYNLYYDGNFYETTIPSAGLTYIYFGS